MRDPKRIKDFTYWLGQLWERYPDLRFFQLANFIEAEYNNDGFYVEDDKTIRTIMGLVSIHNREQ